MHDRLTGRWRSGNIGEELYPSGRVLFLTQQGHPVKQGGIRLVVLLAPSPAKMLHRP